MTKREVTLIGGPHDGRTLSIGEGFGIICTIESRRSAIPAPVPLKWWERLLGRKPASPGVLWEPFSFSQHQYDARTGQYIKPVEDM